ncbi:unnamed protein product, partial [marine sediment metagenome]
SVKIEDFIINTIEKRLNYNITANTYGPAGDDSPGLSDDRVFLASIDQSQGKMVVLGHLSVTQGAEPGEKIIYSRDDDGNTVAKIYFQKDGKLTIETDDEINVLGSKKIIIDGTEDVEIKSDAKVVLQNGTSTSTRGDEIQTQLDQMKTDLNNFINTTYNVHTHIVPQTPSGTTVSQTPVPPGTSTTASFVNITTGKVLLPGVGE